MAACKDRKHRPFWRVVDRECNYSMFSGGRRTPSAYSKLVCLALSQPHICAVWRTKADYVPEIKDYDENEVVTP